MANVLRVILGGVASSGAESGRRSAERVSSTGHLEAIGGESSTPLYPPSGVAPSEKPAGHAPAWQRSGSLPGGAPEPMRRRFWPLRQEPNADRLPIRASPPRASDCLQVLHLRPLPLRGMADWTDAAALVHLAADERP